jgi:ABC-2 type transport system ATP-binding protein
LSIIKYINVGKKYGKKIAVDNFSLVVNRAEVFGILGPNGAGKTTLIRMTSTLTPVSSGCIQIDGEPIGRNNTRIKQKFGIVPQNSTLENEFSAVENLEYHGLLYGIPNPLRRKRMEYLLELAGLTERKNDRVKKFSGGMRRKLMIIKALMHEPEILLLDEPTTGLDAAWRRKIWDILHLLKNEGHTILLTTHYLEEANILCNRIGLIDKGQLKKTGSPNEIIKEAGNFVLEYFARGVTVQDFFKTREEAIAAAGTLELNFTVREANLEDAYILLSGKEGESL